MALWLNTALLTHRDASKFGIDGSDNHYLDDCLAPSHNLNYCWRTVNWTHENIFQWNGNQNPTTFIEENAFENVVCKTSAMLSQSRAFHGYGIPLQYIILALNHLGISEFGNYNEVNGHASLGNNVDLPSQ